MTLMDQTKLLKVRKRFLEDFRYYARHCVKIRSKSGEIVPLILNEVQERFVDTILQQLLTVGYVRVVTLKARQQGLSTVISAFMYWWLSQHKAQKGIVIAHKADSARSLFDMYRRMYQNTPAMLKPSTAYSSRKELQFDKLDTGLLVATAGGEGVSRGETLTHEHLSELAFWPPITANENLNALLQSIPNTPGTACFVESTANGYNLFYELWEGAVSGKNGFVPFFSAWFESKEYRTPPPADFERTYEEIELAEKFGLDDAQLYWRRLKVAQNGLDLFKQEYPATPDEAFLASGRPVFDPVVITPLIEKAPSPIKRMAVEEGVLREHSRGELLVYKELDPKQIYTIGADIAVGLRGIKDDTRSSKSVDWSVAQVLDGDKEQVAVWRGQVHPDAFAHVLSALGFYYNTALIAPERNNHGLVTCIRLYKDLMYPNVFLDVTEGQIADRDSLNIGFLTTVKTKPLVIDRLRAEVRDGSIKIHDLTTLREMQTFIVTESGAMEAEEGRWDDCVMALAIANHVHVRRFTPITVTDDFYAEAV